ncbi:MAG: dihydroneopterin aldolase family protein [Thermoplasmataceae archaeon]
MPDIAEQFFNCSDRERAIFEAGIKLGTIYHQYVGAPVSLSNLQSLEEAIRQSVLVQPFVDEASVRINPDNINRHKGTYKYITLTGDMLDVSLSIRYKGSKVKARLRYIREMDYPLMYLED